ncbi:hypothetical protein Tco_0322542 [Tanacetum coccineum]
MDVPSTNTIPTTHPLLSVIQSQTYVKHLKEQSYFHGRVIMTHTMLADHSSPRSTGEIPSYTTIAYDKHIKEQVEKQVPEHVIVQVPERGRLQAEISSQIQQAIDNHIPSLVDESVRNYMSGHILHVHPAQPQTTYVPEQQYQLTSAIHPRDQDDPHGDAPPEEKNSAKRQKTSEYEAHVTGESSG